MNNLITSQALTMSSREIAELVNSRHDKVKQSMERLQKKGVIQLTPMGEVNEGGQTVQVYRVVKRDSYVVVAQLSPEFTAKLVDRWQELEESNQPQLPQTMAQALQLAADQAFQLEAQAPKVAFVDKYVEAEIGSKTFRQVCKLLGAKENQFRSFLIEEKIMYRLGGDWAAYAQHIDAGRFSTKTGVSDYGHAYNAANFTAKGIEYVAAKWAVYQIKDK